MQDREGAVWRIFSQLTAQSPGYALWSAMKAEPACHHVFQSSWLLEGQTASSAASAAWRTSRLHAATNMRLGQLTQSAIFLGDDSIDKEQLVTRFYVGIPNIMSSMDVKVGTALKHITRKYRCRTIAPKGLLVPWIHFFSFLGAELEDCCEPR
jgi:hypothetical protein